MSTWQPYVERGISASGIWHLVFSISGILKNTTGNKFASRRSAETNANANANPDANPDADAEA